ncbi:hypothetical protein Tco_0795420 [Tanacetum coccineum]
MSPSLLITQHPTPHQEVVAVVLGMSRGDGAWWCRYDDDYDDGGFGGGDGYDDDEDDGGSSGAWRGDSGWWWWRVEASEVVGQKIRCSNENVDERPETRLTETEIETIKGNRHRFKAVNELLAI